MTVREREAQAERTDPIVESAGEPTREQPPLNLPIYDYENLWKTLKPLICGLLIKNQ